MNHTFLRSGALLAAATLTVAGVTLIAAPAHAAVDTRPAELATAWLATQLEDGVFVNAVGEDEVADYDTSIDAGLGLLAVGGQELTVEVIAEAVGPAVVDDYTGADDDHYAGPLARSLVFAQTAGLDPLEWAEVDLVAELEAQVTANGPSTGRVFDSRVGTDLADVVAQAYAVRSLGVAESSAVSDATDFLLQQQCSAGYFRANFTKNKGAVDQSCDGGSPTGISAPSIEVTARAVLQLTSLPDQDENVTSAIDAATTWLSGVQSADGAFDAGPTADLPNSTSTGLAGWALGEAGYTDLAGNAAGWVRARQADEFGLCLGTEDLPNGLEEEIGAIAPDAATLSFSRTNGIDDLARAPWNQSTAEAVAVLQWAPANPAPIGLTKLSPGAFEKGGTTGQYLATGLAPGEKVCISLNGVLRVRSAGLDGNARFTYKLPSMTVNRPIAVRDFLDTTARTTLKILGPKTLKVTNTVPHIGKSMQVKVTGLAVGETITVKFRGTVVKVGHAGATGSFATSVKVTGATGKTTVSALGQYGDIRRGFNTVSVVP